jgi:hypothetical protein
MNSAKQLKAMSPVEGDTPRTRRFKIGKLVVSITLDKCVLRQQRAKSFALLKRVDTHKRQIPMRLAWVIATHLVKYCNDILSILLRHAALEYATQYVFVREDARWEPQCSSSIAINVVSASV